MEREILFRGKRVDSGEWIYGYYVKYQPCASKDKFVAGIVPEYASDLYMIEVIPLTVGRFTGLTDKNGTKIFEGDILQRSNNPKDIVRVVFGKFPVIDMETESAVDEVTGWHCDVISTDALSRTIPFCLPMPLTDYYIDRCDMEVVGNVHDNPEMLKGEELKNGQD